MRAVGVETEPTFSPGNPEVLFETPYRISLPGRGRSFDLSPDGERFLMIKEDAPAGETGAEAHIIFVQDWFQELTERLPVP